jgi:phospholipid transport system substrate-binding protein
MRVLLILQRLALALPLLLWVSAASKSSDDESVRAFVARVNEASMSFYATGSVADARFRCRELLAWAFDVPAMGRQALGKAWYSATESERKDYMQAFEQLLVTAYLRRMRAPGTTLTFLGHRPPIDGDRLAASRRSVSGKPEFDQIWIWRMRPEGQSWRIVDLLLDGSSALNSEAEDYADILESNNGDIRVLIASMRKRATQ